MCIYLDKNWHYDWTLLAQNTETAKQIPKEVATPPVLVNCKIHISKVSKLST